MTLFSIIIPVFNAAPFLRECLDSLLSQTCADWEAICVDDGSTDQSATVLAEYKAMDRRFRVFYQRNAGVSAARNKALSESKGGWICFLDADDVVQSEWLSHLADEIHRHPDVDWLRTSFSDWYVSEGKRDLIVPCRMVNEYLEGERALNRGSELIAGQGLMVLNVYPRRILSEIKFDIGTTMREDALFALTVLPRINSLRIVNSTDYLYRRLPVAGRRKFSVGDAVHFQKALQALWHVAPSSVRCFSILAFKNIQWWAMYSNDRSWRDAFRIICTLLRSIRDGSLSIRSLPTGMMLRLMVFLVLWNRRILNRGDI